MTPAGHYKLLQIKFSISFTIAVTVLAISNLLCYKQKCWKLLNETSKVERSVVLFHTSIQTLENTLKGCFLHARYKRMNSLTILLLLKSSLSALQALEILKVSFLLFDSLSEPDGKFFPVLPMTLVLYSCTISNQCYRIIFIIVYNRRNLVTTAASPEHLHISRILSQFVLPRHYF